MKADINLPSKSNKQKNLFFVCILSAIDEKYFLNEYLRYGTGTRCPPWMDSWHSCVCRADADHRSGAERRGRTAEAGGGRVRMAATGGGRVRMTATGGGRVRMGEGCGEGGRGAGVPGPPTPPAAGPPAGPEHRRS
jgi:hypothetical protein